MAKTAAKRPRPKPAARKPRKKAASRRRRKTEPSLTVVDSVRRDLAKIAQLDPELAQSGLAASALALAKELDKPANSATSKSMCARALAEALSRLQEQAPEPEEEDKVKDLGARRRKRLKKKA